jgi:hypothetical protein
LYVRRALRLAFLSPEVTSAILEGRQQFLLLDGHLRIEVLRDHGVAAQGRALI